MALLKKLSGKFQPNVSTEKRGAPDKPEKREQQRLPSGDPPTILEDILSSEDWYPVFFEFLKECVIEDEQASAKLLKACKSTFEKHIFESDNKQGLKVLLGNISFLCRESVDSVVADFPKYVQVHRRLQAVAESRREERGHYDCDCHRALAQARNVIQTQGAKDGGS